MKSRFTIILALAFLSIASAADGDKDKGKDKPKSDLLPPDKRRPSVELAQQLTRPSEAEKLPAEFGQPFNPPGFDLPDRDERPPIATQTSTRGGDSGGAAGPAVVASGPAPVLSDRELLESLAAKLPAASYLNARGDDMLTFGSTNRVKVGGVLTITQNGQSYELVVTKINSNNFTIRYHNQEFTRPNKPGK